MHLDADNMNIYLIIQTHVNDVLLLKADYEQL